jgi:PAS domain S-box-containing protein
MNRTTIRLTGRERTFHKDELIVSKTDLRGRITYANPVFMRVAGYEEAELLGQAHSIIRHPDMPRCVFKLLWDTIEDGQEIFAYVINLCKNGDHYWVFAHVTPSFDARGRLVGYHSSRRVPDPGAVQQVKGIYQLLRAEEQRYPVRQTGMEQAGRLLGQYLAERNTTYEAFVFSL